MCKECDKKNGTNIYSHDTEQTEPEVLTHEEPPVQGEELPQPQELTGNLEQE